MEDMNFLQQETSQKDFDQFFKGVNRYLDIHNLREEDVGFNQDYELKAKTLKETDNLTIDDCIWLENVYLMRKGIRIFKSEDNIEVTKSDHTPIASFEFSPKDFNSSYVKVIKLCLDLL